MHDYNRIFTQNSLNAIVFKVQVILITWQNNFPLTKDMWTLFTEEKPLRCSLIHVKTYINHPGSSG